MKIRISFQLKILRSIVFQARNLRVVDKNNHRPENCLSNNNYCTQNLKIAAKKIKQCSFSHTHLPIFRNIDF